MLINCCECFHSISTNAKQCPNCGYNYGYEDVFGKYVKGDPKILEQRMSLEEFQASIPKLVEERLRIRNEELQKQRREWEAIEAKANALPLASASANGCFIATAAYGTPLAQEISILRRFKDEHLARFYAGRIFVSTYYRLSPPVAAVIKQNKVFRAITRAFLRPVIWLLQK